MTTESKNNQKKTPKDEFMAPVADARTFADLITRAEQQLTAASGGRLDTDRLARLNVLTRIAAQKNPDLLSCTRESVYWAFLDAARTGLEWDGEQGALVPYNVKIPGSNPPAWRKEAKFIPMYRGLVHLLADAGVCHDIRAVLVYKGDVFRVIQGTAPQIIHEPDMVADRVDGDIVAAYAVFVLRDGTVKFDVMSRSDLLKRKDASRAKFGPWQDWFGEMCLKTVIKHGTKVIPRLPIQARSAIDVDNRADTGDRGISEESEYLIPPAPRTALSGTNGAERKKGLAALAETLGAGMAALAETLGAGDDQPPDAPVTEPPPEKSGGAAAPVTPGSTPPAVDAAAEPPGASRGPTPPPAEPKSNLPPITDDQKVALLTICEKGGAKKMADKLGIVRAALNLTKLDGLSDLTARQAEIAIARLQAKPEPKDEPPPEDPRGDDADHRLDSER